MIDSALPCPPVLINLSEDCPLFPKNPLGDSDIYLSLTPKQQSFLHSLDTAVAASVASGTFESADSPLSSYLYATIRPFRSILLLYYRMCSPEKQARLLLGIATLPSAMTRTWAAMPVAHGLLSSYLPLHEAAIRLMWMLPRNPAEDWLDALGETGRDPACSQLAQQILDSFA